MRSIAPGQHPAAQKQPVAMFPARHFFGGQIVKIDPLGGAVRLPVYVGPFIQLWRLEIGRSAAVEGEMRMAGGGAIGNHRHRLARCMAGRIVNLHIKHGRKPAQPLRAHALGIHGIVNVDPQLFDIVLRAALLQLRHIDRVHEALLGQLHAMFCRAANTDAEHARRTPSGAHRRYLFKHPVDDIVAGIHHLELGLVLAPAALRRHVDFNGVARHHLDRQDARRVVARVAAGESRIGQNRGAQLVIGMIISAANAFIDDLLQAHCRIEMTVLPPFDEDIYDPRVLADGPVPFCTHPAVGQDLRDCVFRCRALFRLIGITQRANIVHWVVVRDILQRIGNALDQVCFTDLHNVAHRFLTPAGRFRLP